MAERLENYIKKSPKGKYPWDEWMDGAYWRLKQGEDFLTSLDNFRSSVSVVANKRGGTASVHKEDDTTIVIRFIKNGEVV